MWVGRLSGVLGSAFLQTLFVAGYVLMAMQILRDLPRLRIMLPPLREKRFSAKADVISYLATDPVGSTLPPGLPVTGVAVSGAV